jgi:hypothetical protein
MSVKYVALTIGTGWLVGWLVALAGLYVWMMYAPDTVP